MKAMMFKCPDCDEHVAVRMAVWEDNEVRLVGKCDECGQTLRFSTDKLVVELANFTEVPTNLTIN